MTINSALERDISLENMLSYGEAIREVATIFESMHDGEYDFLIVPSRGASPIVDMCRIHWTSRREPWGHRGGMRRVVESFLANPISKALHLPFTADAGNLPLSVEPRDVRRFWCRVVAGMISDPDADPFFRFYEYLRFNVCGEQDLATQATMYDVKRRPAGKRFAFLDTAVSGRAVCEIMDGFADAGLTNDIFYIVVIDENGAKLRPEYKLKLELAKQAGRAELVYLPRLFTEDQGPAISGIWSVVFPEIMEEALKAIPELGEASAAGAGIYYWSVNSTISESDPLIDMAITLRRNAFLSAVIMPNEERIQSVLADYRTHVHEHRLFDKKMTLEIARPRIQAALRLNIRALEASSSHVVRVSVDRDQARSAVDDFLSGSTE